ncbi:MAG: DUF4783 domain-containing protein [Bacteroidales bacterium]|nr:DUF4783 domain-containing protein [Bacteroidales bacterium]
MNVYTKIIPILLIGTLFLRGGATGYQEEIPRDIAIAFKVGTAKELARFFNNNLELAVGEKEDVYSKSQAERIMDNFFVNHPPRSFKFIHQGGKETARYAIGKLVTFNGEFRVYMLLKQKNGQSLIHQLRIENEIE